jgi:hypothetical protein
MGWGRNGGYTRDRWDFGVMILWDGAEAGVGVGVGVWLNESLELDGEAWMSSERFL